MEMKQLNHYSVTPNQLVIKHELPG